MEKNNHQINDYSAVLERKYGKKGSVERAKLESKMKVMLYCKDLS